MGRLKTEQTGMLYRSLLTIISHMNNKDWVYALEKYFEKIFYLFVSCPGSIRHHHNYTSGLLEHTLEVVLLARHMSKVDELIDLDYDKVVLASVLHDIGKINQYTMEKSEWTYAMTKEESRSYDHGLWVIKDFEEKTGVKLPEDVKEAIATHHGGWNKNNIEMKGLLSAVLHGADLISSRFD